MTVLQWTGVLLLGLAVVSAVLIGLWRADARRADRVATGRERVARLSWHRPNRHRAAHRAQPHS